MNNGYNNNYNNGYNNGYNEYQQYSDDNYTYESSGGTSILSKIIIVIVMIFLVAALVLLIVYATGGFDKEEQKQETETKEVEDNNKVDDNNNKSEEPIGEEETKEENKEETSVDNTDIYSIKSRLEKGCSSLSSDGYYNENNTSTTKTCTGTEVTCITYDNVLCAKDSSSSICMITTDDETYTMTCSDSKLKSVDKKGLQANINLNTMCATVDNKGSYSGDLGTCENFECKTTVESETFTKKCNEE